MLSYDQAAAKVQWRDAVRTVTEAIEDAGGVVNNVNDASTASLRVHWGISRSVKPGATMLALADDAALARLANRRHPHPRMSTRSTAADLQETRGCSR